MIKTDQFYLLYVALLFLAGSCENVHAGGSLSTLNSFDDYDNDRYYDMEEEEKEEEKVPVFIPHEQPKLSFTLKEVIPHAKTAYSYPIPYEADPITPTIVQNQINLWPVTCYTPNGPFGPSGSFALHDNGKTYIWICSTHSRLECTMKVTNCIRSANTIHIYCKQVLCNRQEGQALHNTRKLICIDDPRGHITKYGLVNDAKEPTKGYVGS